MTRTRVTLLVLLAAATDARYLNVSGDITLGALFPVHKKGSDGNDCGQIQVSSISLVAFNERSLGSFSKSKKKIYLIFLTGDRE